MPDTAALTHRELGGPDVHAHVHLHGVGVDHISAQALGQRDGEVALAGGRGSHDGDDRWLTHGTSVADASEPDAPHDPALARWGKRAYEGSRGGNHSEREAQ